MEVSCILTHNTKFFIFIVVIGTTLLWGAESWPVTGRRIRKLQQFWNSRVRWVLGISWERMWRCRISYLTMRRMLGVDDIWVMWEKKIATWMGHVSRMKPERFSYASMFGRVPHRVAPPREESKGSKRLWTSTARRVLYDMGLQADSWQSHTADRSRWRAFTNTLAGKSMPDIFRMKVQQEEKDKQTFKCHICGQVTKSKGGLTSHLKVHARRDAASGAADHSIGRRQTRLGAKRAA